MSDFSMDLNEDQITLRDWVHGFAEQQMRPIAAEWDEREETPWPFIQEAAKIGIYGLDFMMNAFADKTGLSMMIALEELAWGDAGLCMALMGTTLGVAAIVSNGTPEQQMEWVPRCFGTPDDIKLAAFGVSEPDAGSDVSSLRTRAIYDEANDEWILNGTKTWITNARRAGLVALLCKTDPAADPAYRGMSILLVEKVPGLTVSRDLPKLGYKGVESCEIALTDCRVPTDALLGTEEGRGFAQMMAGLELGRIQVAARAVGVARAAFEDALAYAQQREAFGRPIWRHQSIGNYLADMATKVTAARLLVVDAADRLDAGRRCDLEAGMAKLFASEIAMQVALDALRIHGGYGYSTEFDVERYFRDAPLMIVGEGTNEIQRDVIVRQLIARGGLDA